MIMLRYFYLLSLLVYIEWSFCYEFIPHRDSNRLKVIRNEKPNHRRKNQLRSKRQEFVVEDPVAHIDVASFMQQPDPEYNSFDDGLYEINKKVRMTNDYGEYDSLAEPQVPQQESLTLNSPSLDNSYGIYSGRASLDNTLSKSHYPESPADAGLVHKTENKCSKTFMRFPFFSHKKTVAPKMKKNKKRKLFHFHSSKTTEGTTSLPKNIDPNAVMKVPHIGLKIDKRDIPESFCPLCERNIFPKSKKKVKILHNSRQYYQNAGDMSKVKQKKETVKFDNQDDGEIDDREYFIEDGNDNPGNVDRKKRNLEFDRERQLKELEEVQKKVDGVEITSPNQRRIVS